MVAEPFFLIRKGISSLINEMPNATVVRETETSNRLTELVTHYSALALVVNVDLLKELSASELKKLTSRKKQLFIIGLTSSLEDENLENKVVFSQIISLSEQKTSIVKKLRIVLSQIDAMSENPSSSSELSEREIEILKDVALGLSNKEIAEKNFISPHTVITHRKNITRKLGIKTVSGLTIYAILNKYIGMDELN
jgi:DNA-binding NarL/FixJ family response regulator